METLQQIKKRAKIYADIQQQNYYIYKYIGTEDKEYNGTYVMGTKYTSNIYKNSSNYVFVEKINIK